MTSFDSVSSQLNGIKVVINFDLIQGDNAYVEVTLTDAGIGTNEILAYDTNNFNGTQNTTSLSPSAGSGTSVIRKALELNDTSAEVTFEDNEILNIKSGTNYRLGALVYDGSSYSSAVYQGNNNDGLFEHLGVPLESDYTFNAEINSSAELIIDASQNGISAKITGYKMIIKGYDAAGNTGNPVIWGALYVVTDGALSLSTIKMDGSEYNDASVLQTYTHTGGFISGNTYELIVTAENATGPCAKSETHHFTIQDYPIAPTQISAATNDGVNYNNFSYDNKISDGFCIRAGYNSVQHGLTKMLVSVANTNSDAVYYKEFNNLSGLNSDNFISTVVAISGSELNSGWHYYDNVNQYAPSFDLDGVDFSNETSSGSINLVKGITYAVKVRFGNNYGYSDESPVQNVTPFGAPEMPDVKLLAGLGNDAASQQLALVIEGGLDKTDDIDRNGGNVITLYTVEHGADSQLNPSSTINSNNYPKLIGPGANDPFLIGVGVNDGTVTGNLEVNLRNGILHYVRVTATNAYGSTSSDIIGAAPTDLSAGPAFTVAPLDGDVSTFAEINQFQLTIPYNESGEELGTYEDTVDGNQARADVNTITPGTFTDVEVGDYFILEVEVKDSSNNMVFSGLISPSYEQHNLVLSTAYGAGGNNSTLTVDLTDNTKASITFLNGDAVSAVFNVNVRVRMDNTKAPTQYTPKVSRTSIAPQLSSKYDIVGKDYVYTYVVSNSKYFKVIVPKVDVLDAVNDNGYSEDKYVTVEVTYTDTNSNSQTKTKRLAFNDTSDMEFIFNDASNEILNADGVDVNVSVHFENKVYKYADDNTVSSSNPHTSRIVSRTPTFSVSAGTQNANDLTNATFVVEPEDTQDLTALLLNTVNYDSFTVDRPELSGGVVSIVNSNLAKVTPSPAITYGNNTVTQTNTEAGWVSTASFTATYKDSNNNVISGVSNNDSATVTRSERPTLYNDSLTNGGAKIDDLVYINMESTTPANKNQLKELGISYSVNSNSVTFATGVDVSFDKVWDGLASVDLVQNYEDNSSAWVGGADGVTKYLIVADNENGMSIYNEGITL